MEKVLQWTCHASSLEEAEMIVSATQPVEGCIDARHFGSSVTAHFDMDIPEDAVPDGCRLVPRSIVAYLQRHDEKGCVG
jgi:hypothetical protein